MKSYKIAVFALAALASVSCADKARVRLEFDTDMTGSQIVVRQLDGNVYKTLDTLAIKSGNAVNYKLDVAKGQPEFVYMFKGDTQVAALLLETGENAVVKADTLGNYSVEGSEGSALLAEVNGRYSDFAAAIVEAGDDPSALGAAYIKHYRESVRYVMEHPFSLTAIPVLYETLNNLPIFAQNTDAIFFRSVCDSLKTVYPESRYVKALDKEASRREQLLSLQTRIATTEPVGYPDLNLPGINGQKVSITGLDSKVVLVHFWDSSDAAQKMLNIDALLPLYKEFHGKGFEIYAVSLDTDKAGWASVVKNQNLPWINVNDGLGVNSPAVPLYNVTRVPASYLIADGSIEVFEGGVESLRAQLAKLTR